MPRMIIHLIPHTHWDREWYLPLGGFRARLVSALDGLLAQLERDPRIRSFLLDGQTVVLEDYLAVRPEQTQKVSALVQAGRLQIGPWYILADEQIPAGESLIRNLMLGGSAVRRLGNEATGRRDDSMKVLYSPDAFGHPSCLPTLGNEFGIQHAVVWRGLGSEATNGRDLFWWEGPGSARVLGYHLPRAGYEIGADLPGAGERLTEVWQRVAAELLPRAATRQVAVFVGADHHAPAPRLGDLAARLAALSPECDFRFSRLEEFFEAAGADLPDLAVARGELRSCAGYTWALQGVHGTRAPLKRRNSRIELQLMRVAEPLVALQGTGPGEGATLRQAWREVVQGHFHDTLAGTASDAVARAMAVRLDDAEAAAGVVTGALLDRLADHDPDLAREGESQGARLLVWNPVPRSRGGVVVAQLSFFRSDVLVGPPGNRRPRAGRGAEPVSLCAIDGSETAPQMLERERGLERVDAARHYPDQDEVERVRIAFPLVKSMPGLGSRLYQTRPRARKPAESFASAEGRLVWNGRLALGLDRDGTAVLRSAGRTPPFVGLLGLESERDIGDTYSFCPAPRDAIRRPGRAVRARVTASGPLVGGLQWELVMRCGSGPGSGPGRVSAQIRIEAIGDAPALRCCLVLDNQARDHRLRLRFPTGLARGSILAGTQFGVVERPADGTDRPSARPSDRRSVSGLETSVTTAPAHRFVAVARGDRGLAVLAPGFFEYQWTSRGDLLITLLRSVGELSRANLHTRPGHAGWPTPTPEAQCLGRETIELGLAWVTGADLGAPDRLFHLWEDTFLPPVAHWIRDYGPAGQAAAGDIGCELEGDGLILSALKPAEVGTGIVARCFSVREEAVRGRFRFGRRIARALQVRADETPIGELSLEEADRAVAFTVPGRGMASVRIEWAD